jgi:hypothetical protein
MHRIKLLRYGGYVRLRSAIGTTPAAADRDLYLVSAKTRFSQTQISINRPPLGQGATKVIGDLSRVISIILKLY